MKTNGLIHVLRNRLGMQYQADINRLTPERQETLLRNLRKLEFDWAQMKDHLKKMTVDELHSVYGLSDQDALDFIRNRK